MNKTHPNEKVMISVGDNAPDFELMDHANNSVSISHTLNQATKPLILVFYRGDW